MQPNQINLAYVVGTCGFAAMDMMAKRAHASSITSGAKPDRNVDNDLIALHNALAAAIEAEKDYDLTTDDIQTQENSGYLYWMSELIDSLHAQSESALRSQVQRPLFLRERLIVPIALWIGAARQRARLPVISPVVRNKDLQFVHLPWASKAAGINIYATYTPRRLYEGSFMSEASTFTITAEANTALHLPGTIEDLLEELPGIIHVNTLMQKYMYETRKYLSHQLIEGGGINFDGTCNYHGTKAYFSGNDLTTLPCDFMPAEHYQSAKLPPGPDVAANNDDAPGSGAVISASEFACERAAASLLSTESPFSEEKMYRVFLGRIPSFSGPGLT